MEGVIFMSIEDFTNLTGAFASKAPVKFCIRRGLFLWGGDDGEGYGGEGGTEGRPTGDGDVGKEWRARWGVCTGAEVGGPQIDRF